jgi:hypothetical protein
LRPVVTALLWSVLSGSLALTGTVRLAVLVTKSGTFTAKDAVVV